MKGEPLVTRLPGYAGSELAQNFRICSRNFADKRTHEKRERWGEAQGRDLRVRRRIDARAQTHATSLLSRRHSRHASRFISFFALEEADFSGIRLRSSLRVRKRARPSRALFNLAYTLRSARLRAASVSFFNVGKQPRGEQSFRSIDAESRVIHDPLTIAARLIVRNDESAFCRNRGTGAKLNGLNNWTSLSGAKSCVERNVATCRVKTGSYYRHQDT